MQEQLKANHGKWRYIWNPVIASLLPLLMTVILIMLTFNALDSFDINGFSPGEEETPLYVAASLAPFAAFIVYLIWYGRRSKLAFHQKLDRDLVRSKWRWTILSAVVYLAVYLIPGVVSLFLGLNVLETMAAIQLVVFILTLISIRIVAFGFMSPPDNRRGYS